MSAFRGVHARQFLDLGSRDVADLGSLVDGVFLDGFQNVLQARLDRDALHVERALERERRRLVACHRSAGRLVPHAHRVDDRRHAVGVQRTFRGGNAQVAHVEVGAVLLHQERGDGVVLQEVLVGQAVVPDVVRHCQHHGAVGAGTHGHVHVGMHGRRGELRIDGDELGALLTRLAHELPGVHVGLGGVAAPADDGLRVGGVHEVVAVDAQKRALRVQLGLIGARTQNGCAERGGHAPVGHRAGAAHGAVQHAIRPIRRPECHRRSAVLLHRRADLLSQKRNGVVPLDALPLARATLRALDALQGVLQAVGVVHALGLGEALDADAPTVRVLFRIVACRGLDHAALAHRHLQRATASAVAAAAAAGGVFFLGIGSRVLLRQRRQSRGGSTRHRCSACNGRR